MVGPDRLSERHHRGKGEQPVIKLELSSGDTKNDPGTDLPGITTSKIDKDVGWVV
jgi:hypothetical protein